MADVTGPISSMPGSLFSSPKGMRCDDHPDRPAVKRIQGETDSFGCEMIDVCQECLDKYRSEPEDTSGRCDWCKQDVSVRVPTRDYEEGSCGPIYYACIACRKNYFAALREQNESDCGFDDGDLE